MTHGIRVTNGLLGTMRMNVTMSKCGRVRQHVFIIFLVTIIISIGTKTL